MARVRYSPGKQLKRRKALHARIDAMNARAWKLRETSLEKALAILKESYRLAVIAEHPAAAALSLTYQAGIYTDMARYDIALEYDKRALVAYRGIGDKPAQLATLMGIGSYFYLRGRPGAARSYFLRGLALARTLPDEKSAIIPLRNLGIAARFGGRHPEALVYYKEALALAEKTRSRRHRAMLHLNLGNLHSDIDGRAAWAEARRHLRASLALNRGLDDVAGMAYACKNLADLEIKSGNFRAALAQTRRALALCRRCGDRRLPMLIDATRAEALANLGNTAEAARVMRGALRQMEKTGDLHEAAENWRIYAELLWRMKRRQSAADALGNALALAREQENPAQLRTFRQRQREWRAAMSVIAKNGIVA